MPFNKMPALFSPQLLLLALLMLATRFHHTGTSALLPDASVAVFFLAGLWHGRPQGFMLLLALAVGIDYVATSHMGVSDFCLSPAYIFLAPTYAALWYSGVFSQRFTETSWQHTGYQLMCLVAATGVAFFISNGSFFLLSENITDRSFAAYVDGVQAYFPAYLQYSVLYGVVAMIINFMVLHVIELKASSHISE